MSVSVRQEDGIYKIEFAGTFTNGDLSDGARAIADLESACEVVPHRTADLRPVERVEIDFAGVFALAQTRRRLAFPNAFKTAIITSDVVHFGFARMFQTLNDHPQITIAIFGDDEQARTWIESPSLSPPANEWRPPAAN